MTGLPNPDLDATLVLGMASTAIPFARSREAQAERWLRILRLHGEAGTALQALGVSEAPLEDVNGSVRVVNGAAPGANSSSPAAADGSAIGSSEDVVAVVIAAAAEEARRRGAPVVASADVLRAVMDFYGDDFDHVLRAHGTDRDEVLARLELQAA
jgi:hypothetical protein